MKVKHLAVSLIFGLSLTLGLLMTLGMAATAATPSTIVGEPAPLTTPPSPATVGTAGSANLQENGFDDLPSGLAPAIARALADELPSGYHLRATGSGYRADNAAHDLATTFDAAGLHIEITGETWRLALTGLGRGSAVEAVPAAELIAKGPRLAYQRGPLIEWYLNTNWGLEQGFTIHTPPPGSGDLMLELTMSGSLQASLQDMTTLLLANAAGRTVARYAGLHAYDATGRQLFARLTIRPSQLAIHVDDAGAAYPITVDPWIQRAKLTASDGGEDDRLGISVAIDGDTIVAGADGADVGINSNQGAVYVFVRSGSNWNDITQTAKLTAADGTALDYLGISVDIDGDTIVAGAASANVGPNNNQGAVYVFVKPQGGWRDITHTAKLTASDGETSDFFGGSVAIDGDTIVAGADGADIGGNSDQGAVYVFVKPPGGWSDGTQIGKLTVAGGAQEDFLGNSVAIDGSTIVAGAPYVDVGGTRKGAAYVFVKPMGGWSDGTHTARLTADDGISADWFGGSVAVDDDTVVAGAKNANVGGKNNQGAAYVFVEPLGGWSDITHTAKLTATDGITSDSLGNSVAIYSDTVIVGANGATVGTNDNQGAVYVFVKPLGGWRDITHTAKLTATDGITSDSLGKFVAIDSETIAAGANGADIGTNGEQGAVYVFVKPSELNIQKTVTPTIASPGDTVTYTLVFSNAGSGYAFDVVITDTVPVSVTSAVVISQGVAITRRVNTRYVWDVADLAAGRDGVITITGVLSDPLEIGTFDNKAVITTTSTDVNPGNNENSADLTVVEPEITVHPPSLAFGDQDVDAEATVSQTVAIINDGTADLHISSVGLTGADAGEFTIASDSGQITLTPGSTRTVQISFNPATTGTKSANLNIQSDDGDEATVAVTLSGRGIDQEITIAPTSLLFGSQDVDAGATVSQSVTITNNGSADLHIASIGLTGADASEFIVESDSGEATLLPGYTRTVQVAFDPASVGSKSASLSVVSDDSDEPTVDVALSGAGTNITDIYTLTVSKDGTGSGTVTSDPADINCGAICQASFTDGAVVTLTAAATGGSTFDGWAGEGCSGTGTCPVTMDAARQVTATFNIVTGHPSYSSTPAPGSLINVGTTNLGNTISTTLTVSETGDVALVVTPTLNGPDARDFGVAPSTLTIPDGGAAQDLTISCTPTATETLAVTLTVAHNAPGGPATYPLSCTGRLLHYLYLPLVLSNY